MQRLAADGELSVYFHPGFWQPMDTLRDKRQLEELGRRARRRGKSGERIGAEKHADFDHRQHGVCRSGSDAVPARQLPEAELIGFDAGFFGHSLTGAELLPEALLNRQVFGDIREFPPELLDGVDAVVHLSAVSNDPMGNKFEAVTNEINQQASVRLAQLAAERGVKNFVFASSCSMYGYAEGGARKETDPTNPLTAYARSKIGSEQAFAQLDLGGMAVDLAALRHRLRHVGPAEARSRAQRFRRLRDRVEAKSRC